MKKAINKPWVVINILTKEDIEGFDSKAQAMKKVEGLNNFEELQGRPKVFAVIPRTVKK